MNATFLTKYNRLRAHSETICQPLALEDYSVQPASFVSPPKWHLAHTTWFWEEFVLSVYLQDYEVYHAEFSFLFNSYYNAVGNRVQQANRGVMTRPTVAEVYAYRKHVDKYMQQFFRQGVPTEAITTIQTGLQHEEQHQELLIYDIKYIFGHQVLSPTYGETFQVAPIDSPNTYISVPAGIYKIGYDKKNSPYDFCFDNELGRHKVYLEDYQIAKNLVSNREYLEFVQAGGYQDFNLWLDEGWHWVQQNKIIAPLYWKKDSNEWSEFDLHGTLPLVLDTPVRHVSFYEAMAYAQWRGQRLATEAEWEIAAPKLNRGSLWEWTNSAYLPYPNFQKAAGALGEYNGKFMVNQMVLRGSSVATPKGHSRISYRNFFHAAQRWQYNGIRLAK